MALSGVSLKTQQAYSLALRKRCQLFKLTHRRVQQTAPVGLPSSRDVTGPVALPVLFRIPKAADMRVSDADFAKRACQRGLGEPWSAREWQFSDVHDVRHADSTEHLAQLIDAPPLVSNSGDRHAIIARPSKSDQHSRYATSVSFEPIIGEPLPNAALAVIPHQKLTDYALDPEHDDGGPKAHVFSAVLGIERSDWRYLHDAILEDLPVRPVSGAREPSRPGAVRTWEVMIRVEGLNGHTAWVLTGWKIIDERPVLVTLRVAPKGRQGPDGGVR